MSDFLIVPLRSLFSATLAKRWKVQFRHGFAQFNNVDSKNDIKITIYITVYIIYIYIYKQYKLYI